MTERYDIVIVGLSLSSSWGNGHATTFRALISGLHSQGQRVLFLERDVPWYANNRDLPAPDFCTLRYYDSIDDLVARYAPAIGNAEAAIVGSYVPDGVDVIDALGRLNPRQLCFYDIDTPVTLAKLERGEEDYVARRQIPHFDFYFSFSGGPVLTRLEQDFGAGSAQTLYCSVDAAGYGPTAQDHIWDLGYLGTYSADRQPALERLLIEPARQLPERRFVVAGPQYPDNLDWPDNVERIPHLPPAEHRSFYNRQRFTLNVTRADMIAAGWSPSVRLFEAAACGTPLISDAWSGIEAFFPPGDAIILAHDTKDVVVVLENMNTPQREAIAASARQRVLAEHSSTVRSAELIAMLGLDQHPVGRLAQKGTS